MAEADGAEICIAAGAAEDFLGQVTEETTTVPAPAIDLSVAVDGTPSRPALIYFVARRKSRVVLKKRSYDPEEINILNQTTNQGQFVLLLNEEDTDSEKEFSDGRYELAIARQDIIRADAQAGTGAVTAGQTTVVGAGTSFTDAKKGDIIHPTSGAVDGMPARIIDIVDATNLVTDRVWTVSEASFTFEIRRGKMLPGGRGAFVISESQVKLEL